MKRFTETSKWDDPWFRALVGTHKLVFLYVIDRCNNAGFWEVDEDAMAFHTKLDAKHFEGAWKGLDRGIKGASGWVWVRRFLVHQKNEALNASNPAHKQIIAMLREQYERFYSVPEFIEFVAPYKGLICPIGIGIGQVKEGVQREPIRGSAYPDELWNDLEFRRIFGNWEDHKSEKGHAMTRQDRQSTLSACHRAGPKRSVVVIQESIASGWKKLVWDFDAGRNGNGHSAPPKHDPLKGITTFV